MRISASAALFLALLVAFGGSEAKKPSRSHPAAAASTRRVGSSSGSSRKSRPSQSAPRRRPYDEDLVEEEEEELEAAFGLPESLYDEEEEEREDSDAVYEDEEDEEEVLRPMPSRSRREGSAGAGSRSRGPPPSRPSGRARGPPHTEPRRRPASSRGPRFDEEYDDEYDYPPPRRSGRSSSSRRGPPAGSSRSGSRRSSSSRSRRSDVVPYVGKPSQPGAFTRGLAALRESIPDPSTVKEAAASTLTAARATTSKLSSNIYREVKGLTSSELEQVMLKATRPDDSPVKSKHVERLVGVTYQISARYDIYDSVLRKLWNKMSERDWRTTTKALYVLHRFSADGAPEHQAALKARLRELRRTQDPKRKDKYFNSKQLLAGDSTPETIPFRAFMARYAHYVLLRAQCFGGIFREISEDATAGKSSKSSSSKPVKPITSTSLRSEHLEAAKMLLKAGCACALKDDEVCENTAIAVERVASDLIGLTTAVAMALNRALKGREGKGADPALIKRWCEFYSEELLPQTKDMVKKTSAKLDAYGLFLPSRMGASVSPELLQKGLQGGEDEEPSKEEKEAISEAKAEAEDEKATGKVQEEAKVVKAEAEDEVEEEQEKGAEETRREGEDLGDEYDEYDYEEEEEYYDDGEA